jgi:hypothetical protein
MDGVEGGFMHAPQTIVLCDVMIAADGNFLDVTWGEVGRRRGRQAASNTESIIHVYKVYTVLDWPGVSGFSVFDVE